MQFIVHKSSYDNVVDVRLHPESKKALIKGALYWTGTAAVTVASVLYIKNVFESDQTEIEE